MDSFSITSNKLIFAIGSVAEHSVQRYTFCYTFVVFVMLFYHVEGFFLIV